MARKTSVKPGSRQAAGVAGCGGRAAAVGGRATAAVDAIIARGSFPEDEARLLLRQLLSALAYCHNLKIVHRDLKPQNIVFPKTGDLSDIKIIDFGLSNTFDGPDALLRTAYAESMARAQEEGCATLAFSLLSAGIFRGTRPLVDVLDVAVAAVQRSACDRCKPRQPHRCLHPPHHAHARHAHAAHRSQTRSVHGARSTFS